VLKDLIKVGVVPMPMSLKAEAITMTLFWEFSANVLGGMLLEHVFKLVLPDLVHGGCMKLLKGSLHGFSSWLMCVQMHIWMRGRSLLPVTPQSSLLAPRTFCRNSCCS
jgi:hypothetical protein